VSSEVAALTECAWAAERAALQRAHGGASWAAGTENVLVLCNGELVPNFMAWLEAEYGLRDSRPLPLYAAMAAERYAAYKAASKHVFVFFDMAVAGEPAGRLVFELLADVCPATVAHFLALVGRGAYAESAIHRIQRGGWIQGGDLIDGSGAHNGEACLEDENFAVPHNARGTLALANTGRHTGGTQFCVSLAPLPWMQGKFVAFGCARAPRTWQVSLLIG
jgi:peptidyl-prolyl cis-trans isomerase-like 6